MIEESSFRYFLYKLHHSFHLKVSKISFLNAWLFSHANDPLLKETSSELTERRSGEQPWRCLPTWRAWAMSCVVDWMLWLSECGGVCHHVPVLLRLLIPHQYSSFWKHTNHIFSSLCIHFLFFHPHNFNFFIQTQNFENKRISIEVFKIVRI